MPNSKENRIERGLTRQRPQRSVECGGAPRHCNSATCSLDFSLHHVNRKSQEISWGTPVKRQLEGNSEYIYGAASNEGLKKQQKRHRKTHQRRPGSVLEARLEPPGRGAPTGPAITGKMARLPACHLVAFPEPVAAAPFRPGLNVPPAPPGPRSWSALTRWPCGSGHPGGDGGDAARAISDPNSAASPASPPSPAPVPPRPRL